MWFGFNSSVSCTGVARMFIAHSVGGYQNEQPLADKFLEFGKHSYTEYEHCYKKTTVYISI